MTEHVDKLLRRRDIVRGKPTPLAVINSLAARLQVAFPDSLIRLWCAADGITLDTINAHIPGPTEMLRQVSDLPLGDPSLERGFIPLLDDHESNLVAMTANFLRR